MNADEPLAPQSPGRRMIYVDSMDREAGQLLALWPGEFASPGLCFQSISSPALAGAPLAWRAECAPRGNGQSEDCWIDRAAQPMIPNEGSRKA